MLAAEMSAREIQLLADEIRQRHPYFDQTFVDSSVDGNFDDLLYAQWLTVSFAWSKADCRARRTNTPPTSLR